MRARRIQVALILTGLVAACQASPGPTAVADPVEPVEYAPPAIRHPWPHEETSARLADRVLPPDGFTRVSVREGSFGSWLRELPVKPGTPQVHLHDGRLKGNQSAQYVVLDVDVGTADLQQCADAVMRLRAEYQRWADDGDQICFRYTSGDEARWSRWKSGWRPVVEGNSVSWEQRAEPDDSWPSFRRYLASVFTYAGTHSLSKELVPVENPARIEIGDVFIRGGFPGHAVLIADVARNAEGHTAFTLIQSYMPAQEMHILINPGAPQRSPWYTVDPRTPLETPEWQFEWSELKRFPPTSCP